MFLYVDMGMDLQGSIKGPNKNTPIVLMMLVYVARHVHKHHQHNWGSISLALGPLMLF